MPANAQNIILTAKQFDWLSGQASLISHYRTQNRICIIVFILLKSPKLSDKSRERLVTSTDNTKRES
jgi:hypothetical protein